MLSKRFKTDVRTDEVKGLEFITALEPVTYNYDIDAQAAWKEENYGEADTEQWEGKYDIEQIRFSGFLAQDVEALANEIGYDFSGVDAPKNDKDVYGLRYAEFVVPLVKAVQEQQEVIDEQQAESEAQQTINEAQQTEIEALRSRLDRMEQMLSLFDSDLEQCCFEYEERHHEPTVNGQQTIADDPKLEQNEPNPFRENSTIRYYLPSTVKIAQLQITDLNGAVLKTFNLEGNGFGQVLISGGSFAAGTYIYSLIIDGEKTDSKRMILL